MWILVEYVKFGEKEYIRSKGDIDACEKFYKDHNIYEKFSKKHIEPNEKSIVESDILYENFKFWFSGRYPNSSHPCQDTFETEMIKNSKNKYSLENYIWKGFNMKNVTIF